MTHSCSAHPHRPATHKVFDLRDPWPAQYPCDECLPVMLDNWPSASAVPLERNAGNRLLV